MCIENLKNAWVMRISPNGNSHLSETLESNEAILGWAKVNGLLEAKERSSIRKIMQEHYSDINSKTLGQWIGSVNRFFIEMKAGDYLLIPTQHAFYIATILEDNAFYLPEKVDGSSAYRRKIKWLNNKKPISRHFASAALQSRLKTRQTISYAFDLIEDIESLILETEEGKIKNFQQELQAKLTEETLHILRNGKMNPDDFEKLIGKLLTDFGGKSTKIIPRIIDRGIDIQAEFEVFGVSKIRVVIQAKHYQPKPPVGVKVVEQLIRGLEHDSSDIPTIAMIVTTGEFSNESQERVQEYLQQDDCQCIEFHLVDGETLARLMVENGIQIH